MFMEQIYPYIERETKINGSIVSDMTADTVMMPR